MQMDLVLSLDDAAGAAGAAVVFIQPYDRTVTDIGDSRTAEGAGGTGGVYGSSTLTDQWPSTAIIGWLPAMMKNQVRKGSSINQGIGGQGIQQIVAYPRPVSVSGGFFTGSITTAGLMTITAIAGGDILKVGEQIVSGAYTGTIASLGTGTGGNGTYNVTPNPSSAIGAGSQINAYFLQGSKTIADTAANPASIVILYMGTNDAGNLAIGGANVNAYLQAVSGLTDPTFVYPGYGAPLPLYNGLPKTLIIVNETRRGVAVDGTINSALSQASAQDFRTFAAYLKKLDFASGDALANPHVVVLDAFEDNRLADHTTDSTLCYPLPGFQVDGLHHTPHDCAVIGQMAYERLNAALTPGTDFSRLPDTTTAANFINSNPVFTTTTGGTIAITGTSSGVLPSGYKLVGGNAGLNIDITTAALGGNLGNEVILHITGTASAAWSYTFSQVVGSSGRNLVNMANDVLRLSANLKFTITSGNVHQVAPQLFLQATDLAHSTTVTGLNTSGPNPYSASYYMWWKNAYNDLSSNTFRAFITPNADLRPYATGVPGFLEPRILIGGGASTVDLTVHISQMGVAKVTD